MACNVVVDRRAIASAFIRAYAQGGGEASDGVRVA